MEKITKKIYWNEWQWKFLTCPAKHRAYFAEFRSGKTFMACMDLLSYLHKYPGSTAGVIRNINSELWTSTIHQFKEIHDWDLTGEAFNKSQKILLFHNNSRIIFFALDRPDDKKKLKNVTLSYVMGDQAEEIDPEIFDMAISRLSHGREDKEVKSVWIGNPEAKDWYWEKFYLIPMERYTGTWTRGGETVTRDYGIYRGINNNWIGFWPPPFLNEHNIAPGYYDDQISTHSKFWNAKYMWALPIGIGGLVHPEYNEHRHIISHNNYFLPQGEEWIRIDAMDYGIANPTVWLFMAYSRRTGEIVIFDEYYQEGMTISHHAKRIQELYKEYSYPKAIIACPRAFQSERDGLTPADEYRRQYGLNLQGYNIGIETRAEICNRLLRIDKIKIFERCKNLRRQIESITWKKIEQAENHALEAFQRGVAWIDEHIISRGTFSLEKDSKEEREDVKYKPFTANLLEKEF